MNASAPVLVDEHEVGELDHRIAIVRLNRPDQLNPIDEDTVAALDAGIDQLAAD